MPIKNQHKINFPNKNSQLDIKSIKKDINKINKTIQKCNNENSCNHTSLNLFGTNHHLSDLNTNKSIVPEIIWDQEKPRKLEPYENGLFEIPYNKNPNEVNFMGGLGENVGHPRSKYIIERPTHIQNIYNMKTRNVPIFTFCEDAKKSNNIIKKRIKVHSSDIQLITHTVKNVCFNEEEPKSRDSQKSDEKIVILMDKNNPLNLDYQGVDYKNTYRKDEQGHQNKREYFIKKRQIDKQLLKVITKNEIDECDRNKKYGLPQYFDIKKSIQFDENIKNEEINWKDNYRAKNLKKDLTLQRPLPEAIPFVPPALILGKIIRTHDKKANVEQMNTELERRKAKIAELVKRQRYEMNAIHQKSIIDEKKTQENLVIDIGKNDFVSANLNTPNGIFQYQNKIYPHTRREINFMQRLMNRKKRELKNRKLFKLKFYQNLGIFNRNYENNNNISVSSVDNDESLNASQLSEQSSDDDCDLDVGKLTKNQFQLRGFQYRLDAEARGKINKKHTSKNNRPLRTCLTRNEWLQQILPKTSGYEFFKKNPSTLIRSDEQPTNDDYIIFEPIKYKMKPIDYSPIKDAIENSTKFGQFNVKQTKLTIKKPPSVKVKRFNLTGYLFGKALKRKKSIEINELNEKNKYGVLFDVIKKCDNKYKEQKMIEQIKINNRMRALDKPQFQRFELATIPSDHNEITTSVKSEESDSDWIPSYDNLNTEHQKQMDASNLSLARSDNIAVQRNVSYSVTNMKAPTFREPTLKIHPRCTRICSPINDDNSSISNDSRYPYNVPRLDKIPNDIIHSPNLNVPKTEYTKLFNIRHHHHHLDHTQHKKIKVRYLPKIPKTCAIKITESSDKKKEENMKSRTNVKLYQRDESEIESVYENNIINEYNLPNTKPFHSRSKTEQCSEKESYLQIIQANKIQQINSIKENHNDNNIDDFKHWFNDKDKYIETLKNDMASIKSCNTSDTSSVCTNFTNDSGSYLLIEGKRVPCDYIRKSYVPFEEINRCQLLKAKQINKENEYNLPYYYVPFSGQYYDMRKITQPKDKFFTSAVRSRYGVRDRLKVDVPSFHSELIGTKEFKYLSQLATEWDEYYQHEIRNRPRIRHFKPRSIIKQVRDSLRKKFESQYIQEYIIEKSIVSEQEQHFAIEVEHFRNVCLPLFTKWEETYYRNYMRKMQQLKPFYEKSDKLRIELKIARTDLDKMEMDIIYTEDNWRQLIILQNFHFLMKEQKWRQEYDWIHKLGDGTLENYKESIEKRTIVNIRKRGKDNAFAVKLYYDENYFKFQMLLPFPDSQSMVQGISMLKKRSFKCLLELHYSMWILANLKHSYNQFIELSQNYISKTTKFAQGRLNKKYFIEKRVTEIRTQTIAFLDDSLKIAISNHMLRTLMPLCDLVYIHLIPQKIRDDIKENATVIEKFAMIENLLINILGEFDKIPADIIERAEKKTRLQKSIDLRQAKRACALELRTHTVIEQLKKNLAPPFKPPKRQGKLPRSYLYIPKKIIKIKTEKISDINKLYYKAFTDKEPTEMENQNPNDIELLTKLQQNCIPFYFDHFLNLHDYYPSYDFKTKIEINEGPEIKRFLYTDVLEAVLKSLEFWEKRKKLNIEEHIYKTQFLYVEDDCQNDA